MSSLMIGSDPLSYGRHFDPFGDVFGKKAKQRRKERVQLAAQSFQEKLTLKRYEQEKEAIETFRAKINAKLGEIERTAAEVASVISEIRRVAEDPILEGDPILDEVDQALADFETGLVQIQSGTVVDTATFDTHKLAISYADAQAALIAMTSLRTRGQGILEDLRGRIEALKAEKIRLEELRRKKQELAQQERVRQEALRREQELRQREEAARRQREQQQQVVQQYREVLDELRSERRAVDRLRQQIERVKARRAEASSRVA